MLKKALFFLALLLLVRSLYFVFKLASFDMANLSEFGQGALLGHAILIIVLTALLFFLARNIWFKKKE